jgi:hypothetical protein
MNVYKYMFPNKTLALLSHPTLAGCIYWPFMESIITYLWVINSIDILLLICRNQFPVTIKKSQAHAQTKLVESN